MMRPIQRVAPVLPVRAYDTYEIDAPLSTHWRQVDCEDAECGAYARGWQTFIDENTERGQHQAWYIRNQSGRSYREARNEHGITVFTFRPGQPCFTTHRKRLDREATFLRHRGDHRQYFGLPVEYDRPDQWVDDFATNQDGLAKRLEKG